MKDLARAQVWRYDRSPARAREREQSMQRTRSLARGERQPTVQRRPERRPDRSSGRDLLEEVQELSARLERLSGEQEQAHGAALNIRLHERERDDGLGF